MKTTGAYIEKRNPLILQGDISELEIEMQIADSGKPQTVDHCEQIAETLKDYRQPASPQVVCAIDGLLEKFSNERAAEGLRRFLFTLPSTPSVVALRLVILGQAESYRQAAKDAGCSHVAVLKQVRSLLGKKAKLPPKGYK
jgi:hypothetical protein